MYSTRRRGLQEEGDEAGGDSLSPVNHSSNDRDRSRGEDDIPGSSAQSKQSSAASIDRMITAPVFYQGETSQYARDKRATRVGTLEVFDEESTPRHVSNFDSDITPSDMTLEDESFPTRDSSGMQVVEAFTRDEMASKLRESLRRELESGAITAEVIPEEAEQPSWTRRCLIFSMSILLLVIVGISVGVVFATRGHNDNYIDGVTIEGMMSEDRFAASIALSQDGSTIAVAAGAAKVGHYAQVYRRDNGSGSWKQIGQTLQFAFDQNTQFEGRLDLSRDGSIFAVSRWNNDDFSSNAGNATVYWYDNGTNIWNELGQVLQGRCVQEVLLRMLILQIHSCAQIVSFPL